MNRNVQDLKYVMNKYNNKKFYFSENVNSKKNNESIINDRKFIRKKFRTPLNIQKKDVVESFNERNRTPVPIISKKNNTEILSYKQIRTNDLNKDEENNLKINKKECETYLNGSKIADDCIHYYLNSKQQNEIGKNLKFSKMKYSKFIHAHKINQSLLTNNTRTKSELHINKTDWMINKNNNVHILQNNSLVKSVINKNYVSEKCYNEYKVILDNNLTDLGEITFVESLKKNSTNYIIDKNDVENDNNCKLNNTIFKHASIQTDKLNKSIKSNSTQNKNYKSTQTDSKLLNNDQNVNEPFTKNRADQSEHFSTIISKECSSNVILKPVTNKTTHSSNSSNDKKCIKFNKKQNHNQRKKHVKLEANNVNMLNDKGKMLVISNDKIKKNTKLKTHERKQTFLDKYLIKNSTEKHLEVSNGKKEKSYKSKIYNKNDKSKEESYHSNLNSSTTVYNENFNKIHSNHANLNTKSNTLEENECKNVGSAEIFRDDLGMLYEFNMKSMSKQLNHPVHFNSVVSVSNKLSIHEVSNVQLKKEEISANFSLKKEEISENFSLKKEEISANFSLKKENTASQMNSTQEYKQLNFQQYLKENGCEDIENYVFNNIDSHNSNKSCIENKDENDTDVKEENYVYINESFFEENF